MTDDPNTNAEPVPGVVIVAPTRWIQRPGYAEALIERIDVTVIDFYRENP